MISISISHTMGRRQMKPREKRQDNEDKRARDKRGRENKGREGHKETCLGKRADKHEDKTDLTGVETQRQDQGKQDTETRPGHEKGTNN